MEITVNRFLGKPDVVAKYEDRLKTVCDKNKLTRAEVDARVNRVSFLLENSRTYSLARSHNAILTRNPQNGQYILSYGGTYTNDETRTITANSLETLLSEMRTGRYTALGKKTSYIKQLE
jgi:hypothetical protein